MAACPTGTGSITPVEIRDIHVTSLGHKLGSKFECQLSCYKQDAFFCINKATSICVFVHTWIMVG